MNKETYTFNFSNMNDMVKLNRLVGVKIKPHKQTETEIEITDFTEANELINRIKAKL